MAIDTRDKRSSAINIGSPWRGMLPLPDGAINQGDRQHVAFLYRGIAASGGSTPAAEGSHIGQMATMNRFMGR